MIIRYCSWLLLILSVAAVVPAARAEDRAEGRAEDFARCIADLQQQARAAGLSASSVNQVLPALQFQSRVLELDQKQPEFTQTLATYLQARVSPERVARGRALYAQHRPFLDQLTRRYAVPGRYLVAFWGLETNYGSYLGKMPVLDSLATLACHPRRSTYFAGELLHALQVMEREALDSESMQGSWAGAMGHTQFMPSSYLRHAIDGDGDGRADLWRSERDALASAANFLRALGWREGERWGREVLLPAGFPYRLATRTEPRPLAEWRGLNVRRADGGPLPEADIDATVLLPAGHGGPAFLVYGNFHVVMGWNQSESYALAVGLLADRIIGAGGLRQPPPQHEPLSRADTLRLQELLVQAGHDVGKVDGLYGPATRRALSAFQHANGLLADGFPDRASLQRLGLE